MKKWFNVEEISAIRKICNELGIVPSHLVALIDCESGWDHTLINGIGAAGLNQITISTAKALGLPSGAELVKAYPTRTAQILGPVFRYLKSVRGIGVDKPGFYGLQDLVVANSMPGWRKTPFRAFSAKVSDLNGGMKNPAEYAAKVVRRHADLYAKFPSLMKDLDSGIPTSSSSVAKIVGAAVVVAAGVAVGVAKAGGL